MGKMPAVLKMARQIYQASWLWRALFHKAITFQMPSQMAMMMQTAINTASKVVLIVFIVDKGWCGLFNEITAGFPLSILFQHEGDGFNG